VTDHGLEMMGAVAYYVEVAAPPGDIDGDGYWEVVLSCDPYEFDEERRLDHLMVLRLGENGNEIVWLGHLDRAPWAARRIRVKPLWRDDDGDGTEEFVFVTLEVVVVTRQTIFGPRKGTASKPPETVAVFEWSGPGGILRARRLPADSGITPWTPVDDRPLEVEQDADLEHVIRMVHPVPGLQPRRR